MRSISLALITVLVVFFLGACKEASLNGPVADAEIHIDLLNQPGAGYQRLDSQDRNDVIENHGVDTWLAMSRGDRLVHMGKFEVDRNLVMENALYLVTARYGQETDADRNREYDHSLTEVQGEWRAIMAGTDLRDCGTRVSALTDAAYEYVRYDVGVISDEALMAKLDEFAMLVVSDLNGDAVVNYRDVLEFSRTHTPLRYKGDLAYVDDLIAAITVDDLEHNRRAAAESVWLKMPVDPIQPFQVERTPIEGVYAGDYVIPRDVRNYELSGPLRVGGDLIVEPGVRIEGNGQQIVVSGDLILEGVPRQITELDDVRLLVETWGASEGSRIRYARFEDSDLNFKIQYLEMSETTVVDSDLEVRNSAAGSDRAAHILRNIFEEADITFYNRSPVRDEFALHFVNNLIEPDADNETTITTRWHANSDNLLVKNNSFHSNMRLLKKELGAVMDARENYWALAPGVDLDYLTIIPDNEDVAIRHFPWLSKAHPDTPKAL